MKKFIVVVIGIIFAAGISFAQTTGRFFFQKNVTANPATAVTVTDKNVTGIFVYSPNINYKIAINGTTYTPMKKGGAFNFSGLKLDTMTLKIMGEGETDTGIVHVIYTK